LDPVACLVLRRCNENAARAARALESVNNATGEASND
jgi:hypothetical protein